MIETLLILGVAAGFAGTAFISTGGGDGDENAFMASEDSAETSGDDDLILSAFRDDFNALTGNSSAFSAHGGGLASSENPLLGGLGEDLLGDASAEDRLYDEGSLFADLSEDDTQDRDSTLVLSPEDMMEILVDETADGYQLAAEAWDGDGDTVQVLESVDGDILNVAEFNPTSDGIVYEVPQGSDILLDSQTLSGTGLYLEFSDGAILHIDGQMEELDESLIHFAEV